MPTRHVLRSMPRPGIASLLAAMLTAAATVAVSAHDIAIFPTVDDRGVSVRVRYGHPGDYQPAVASKLITLEAFAPSGARRSLAGRMRVDGETLLTAPVPAEPGTWVFATHYDNGFFLRTEDGRQVNTTRVEYPAAASATHNVKFGKAIVSAGTPGPGFDRIVGHRLEIVPRQHPHQAGRGGALDVVVHFDGKPIAGASVFVYPAQADAAVVTLKTGADGSVRVPLDRSGQFIIGTERGAPSRQPEVATRDVYAATLTFVLE